MSYRPNWDDPAGGGGRGGFAFPALVGATRKLIWINAAAWFVLFLADRFSGVDPETGLSFGRRLTYFFALDPGAWWDHFPLVPFWQVATYGFVHAPRELTHVLFNLLALYFFGTALEGLIGTRRFVVTYLAALLLGGLVQLGFSLAMLAALEPGGGFQGPLAGASIFAREVGVVPTLGASGAVMAVIIAMATLQPHMQVIFILFPMRLRTLALILVAFDVFRMINGGSDVAWAVHLSGAAYGFAAVRRGFIWRDPLEALARRRAARAVQEEQDARRRLDELLARIHEKGLNSLSESEKAFLKRVSKR